MSRRSIIALLVALALSLGTRAWMTRHADNCDAFRAGDPHAPSTQIVEAGTREVEVPCDDWIHRQTTGIQGMFVLDAAAWFVFVIYLWRDIQSRRRL